VRAAHKHLFLGWPESRFRRPWIQCETWALWIEVFGKAWDKVVANASWLDRLIAVLKYCWLSLDTNGSYLFAFILLTESAGIRGIVQSTVLQNSFEHFLVSEFFNSHGILTTNALGKRRQLIGSH
jgi:hypothetical protein